MTPEQQARQNIEHQLVQCGWIVQDYRDMHISACPGEAVLCIGAAGKRQRFPIVGRTARQRGPAWDRTDQEPLVAPPFRGKLL